MQGDPPDFYALLIDLHPGFFQHPKTCFEPLSGNDEFNETDILYELKWNAVSQFGIAAKVIKPEELGTSNAELVTIQNILSLTMVNCSQSGKWYPGSITNTAIN